MQVNCSTQNYLVYVYYGSHYNLSYYIHYNFLHCLHQSHQYIELVYQHCPHTP